jgi:hypothetical protein
MKEYRNATVINHGHGMSDATYDTIHGTHRARTGPSEVHIDGENAVSTFVRTTRMKNVLQDEFDTVRGDKNYYVGGDFTIRVDGRFNIIAGNTDKKKSIQKEWLDATADLAAAKASGEVKRGFQPIGQPTIQGERSGSFGTNPLLSSEFPSTNSTSNGLESQIDGSLTASRTAGDSGTKAWGKVEGDTTQDSPSTEGGTFEANEIDFENLYKQTQTKLTDIERNMPRNDIPFIADNLVFATSGPPNNRPPGRKDPIGRAERKGMKLFDDGPATEYVGVPHYEEVDNYSDIPFGSINFKAGNNFTIETGNGGINLMTGGGVKIVGGSNTMLGGEQVLIAGQGNVRIHGGSHIGFKGGNIDFQSSSPITMDNLSVMNSAMIGGGMYVNGELFVNHVTAPKEWQKTSNEPTITYATPRSGMRIGTTEDGKIVYGTSAAANSIEVQRHIHWFENLPLTLTGSNSEARALAAGLNNGGVVAASAPQDR